MPAGRPTKYKPEYCDAVVDHMKDGASLTSFAASVAVARSTINEWMAEFPEFSEAAARGKAACAAWWEAVNRNLACTGEGNATACVFGLKNMGKDEWADKTLLGSDPDNPLPASFSVNLVRPVKDD